MPLARAVRLSMPRFLLIALVSSLIAIEPPRACTADSTRAAHRDVDGDPLPPGVTTLIGSRRLREAGSVSNVRYTPDGASLASTTDGFLYLWDARNGKLRWRLALATDAGEQALAISGDGQSIAVMNDYEYIVAATATGARISRKTWPKIDGDEVRTTAISPDLRTIARGSRDASVRLYDAATGFELRRFTAGDRAKDQIPKSIQFGAAGNIVCVTDYDKDDVAVYETATGSSSAPSRRGPGLRAAWEFRPIRA